MSANTQKICRELSDIKEKSCEMYKENQKCIPTVKSKIVMKTELYKNKKAKEPSAESLMSLTANCDIIKMGGIFLVLFLLMWVAYRIKRKKTDKKCDS